MIEAFILFALLVLVDTMAAQRWLPLYYQVGVPVFFARRLARGQETGPFDDQTARGLAERFRARPAHPSIEFHPQPGGALAFRERLFENRGGFKYLPVMHSTARRGSDGSVTITGLLNLYVLFTLAYLIYRVAGDRSYIPVALLVLVVLAVSLATQAAINRAVADALSGELTSPGAPDRA